MAFFLFCVTLIAGEVTHENLDFSNYCSYIRPWHSGRISAAFYLHALEEAIRTMEFFRHFLIPGMLLFACAILLVVILLLLLILVDDRYNMNIASDIINRITDALDKLEEIRVNYKYRYIYRIFGLLDNLPEAYNFDFYLKLSEYLILNKLAHEPLQEVVAYIKQGNHPLEDVSDYNLNLIDRYPDQHNDSGIPNDGHLSLTLLDLFFQKISKTFKSTIYHRQQYVIHRLRKVKHDKKVYELIKDIFKNMTPIEKEMYNIESLKHL